MIIAPYESDPTLASQKKHDDPSVAVYITRSPTEPIPPAARPDEASERWSSPSNSSRVHQHDPPPAYESSPLDPPVSPSPTLQSPLMQIPSQYRPTNFLYMRRLNGGFKDTYVIDPSMQVPHALLPALGQGETEADRKSLVLETLNGGIHANVYIVDSEAMTGVAKRRSCTRLCLSSKNGSVVAKLMAPQPAPLRPRIVLSVSSFNGAVKIEIPRDFRGPLKLGTFNGSVRLSDAVRAQSTDFGEVAGALVCFVGDFTGFDGTDKSDWEGDDIIADTKNGEVRVSYSEESGASSSHSNNKSIFSRILGF